MSSVDNQRAYQSGGMPRLILAAAGVLVAFAFIASGTARFTGMGRVHIPPASPVETLMLRFADLHDGGVAVIDADDGKTIYTVQPGANGFIRATLRGLARERMREGVGETPTFRLTHWNDGTLSLEDATIGRRIGLDAFGPTNVESFARLFAARSHSP